MHAVKEQVEAYLAAREGDKPARMARLIDLIKNDPRELASWFCDLWEENLELHDSVKKHRHEDECFPELYCG